MVMQDQVKQKLLPFTFSAAVILLDQLTKVAITLLIPYNDQKKIFGDFLRFIHVRNPATAFSIGRNLPADVQRIVFSFLPLIAIFALLLYYLFSREPMTVFQRWVFAALLGGGLGNYVDRIFRRGEVVDFIDFKFYGIFGFSRWPTFNLADMTVVVAGILLLLSFVIPAGGKK